MLTYGELIPPFNNDINQQSEIIMIILITIIAIIAVIIITIIAKTILIYRGLDQKKKKLK